MPLEQRPYCFLCRKPKVACYCAELVPVATRPRIVILMHPLEARHRVGTGRLAHRSLANSHLWIGTQFGADSEVAGLIADPGLKPLLLYPGNGSVDLARITSEQRKEYFGGEREPVVIILDATWSLARKMLHHSPLLQRIPRVAFEAGERSRFMVRKQPSEECLSSIEAIHRVLCLAGDAAQQESLAPMMRLFDQMVAWQSGFIGGARGIRSIAETDPPEN